MMKKTLIPLLSSLLASVALAATTELNVAEGTIESADGLFVGRDFHIIDGFKLEMIYHPDTDTEGQWVALGWDDQGRLIVPSYNTDKLMRLTIPAVGEPGDVQVEMIDEPKVGAAEGILYAFDSLYLNVNRSNTMRAGLYRIFDTDGDDMWDTTRVIQNRQGDGSDHGTHTLQLSPDGNRIFMISGNATRMTEHDRSRVPEIWGEDNLVLRLQGSAPGFNRAPEAHIMSYNADGSDIELWSMGMRNPVSFAFNKDGEIFLYDADHEPDFGFISYRPTNVMHAISGADGGWRASSRFHPFYYFDDFGTIAVVGAGSPVPSTFGTGAKFPAEFQDAFFIGDWSFGRLYAVNISPDGSSYKADVRPFLEGRPFAVSGTAVNPADGSMIIQTTGTEMYRVTYVGDEDTTPTQPDTRFRAERDLRHYLESFHGKQDPQAVDVVWPYLKDQDRAIRFAARTALEWQDPSLWRERALNELNPRTVIAAIASLARVTGPDEYHYLDPQWGDKGLVRDPALQARMFAALDRIDWDYLGYQDKLDLLRAYSLVMIRLGRPNQATIDRLIARFDPYLPAVQKELNWELSEMLVYLQAPSAAEKVMALLRNAPTAPYYGFQEWINPQQRQRQDRGDQTGPNIGVLEQDISRQMDQLHYVQLLRTLRTGWTPELRREYLNWFLTEPQDFKGSMGQLTTIRADAIAMIPESERAQYQDLIEPTLSIGGGRGGFGAAANGTPGLGAPAESLWVPGGNGRPMTDVELTALTKFDESVENELEDQTEAKDALTAASFTVSSTPASLQTLVNRLGDAELRLALARADNFDPVRDELNVDSPARLNTVIQAMESRGGRGFGGGGFGGGGGGGRGGAAGGAGGRGGAPAGQ